MESLRPVFITFFTATYLLISSITANAATLEVPTSYPTIQSAVDNAQPGDTVSVLPGTYSERILITKSDLILVTGESGSPAIIDGTNVIDQPPIAGDPSSDPFVAGAGIGIHTLGTDTQPVTGVTIQGFVVHGFERGIVLEKAQFSRIEGTETFNNIDKGICCGSGTTQADGITLIGSSFNDIIGNIADNNGHDGIFIREGSSSNNIMNNITRGNGVMFLPPEDPRAVPPANGALIGCGIQIGAGTNIDNTVEGNEVSDGHWGIQLGPAGDLGFNRIQFNEVHNNSRAAVAMLAPAHDNTIEQNNTTNNGFANIPPSYNFALFDEAELNNTWINNLGTANFNLPGTVPCEDVDILRARCLSDGTVQTRVILNDTSNSNESVTIAISGARQLVPVIGRFADAFSPGFSGPQIVSLDDPEMCQPDVNIDCPDSVEMLSVSLSGTGTGAVTSTPTGIECGTTCTADYETGTIVTLSAVANSGSVFTGFSGDSDCSDGSITVNTNVNCIANFTLESSNGIPCDDVSLLRARCLDDGTIQTRVILTDTSHDGEFVTIAIDGVPQTVPVAGRFADNFSPDFSGPHTVSLENPAMCQADVPVTCP